MKEIFKTEKLSEAFLQLLHYIYGNCITEGNNLLMEVYFLLEIL